MYKHAHTAVFFLEAGSTATDAADINNWVTIPFMAFTIYDFDHDGMNAGYEHMCIRDTDSYGNALDGYFFAGSSGSKPAVGTDDYVHRWNNLSRHRSGYRQRQPKNHQYPYHRSKGKSVAVWLQNFKVFEFETEITLPVSRGATLSLGALRLI